MQAPVPHDGPALVTGLHPPRLLRRPLTYAAPTRGRERGGRCSIPRLDDNIPALRQHHPDDATRATLEGFAATRPFHSGGAAGLSGLRTAGARFHSFCKRFGIDGEVVAGDPSSPHAPYRLNWLAVRYAVFLGEYTALAGGTVGSYVTGALRLLVEGNGICNFKRSAQLDAILRYYHKAKPPLRPLQRQSAPLTAVSAAIRGRAIERGTTEPAARAAIALCFAGGLRLGELVGATRRHASLDWTQLELLTQGDCIVAIRIRFGLHKGAEPEQLTVQASEPVRISRTVAGFAADGNPSCGATAFVRWIAASTPPPDRARTEGTAAGLLARTVPRAGPVFAHEGKRMLKRFVVQLLQQSCVEAVRTRVMGHSLRIAAVTCLDRAGVPFEVIRRFGRWKTAATCERYLRGAREGLPPLEIRGNRL